MNELLENTTAVIVIYRSNEVIFRCLEGIKNLKKDYKSRAIFQVLDYQLDINKKVIEKNDLKLKLTEKEVTLLVYFIQLGRPAKINELLKTVWDYSSESEEEY